MSLLIRKNFKFVNFVKLLSSQSINHNIRPRYVNVGQSRSNQNKLYATAAHNYKINNVSDTLENNNYKPTDYMSDNNGDIDKTLLDIDHAVRRTGRTVVDSVNSVFQAIENNGFVTENQSLYLLRCCGLLRFESPNKRIELVNKFWEKFKSLGVKLEKRHYNSLLKVYLECDENFTPSDILISMEQHSVEPSQETYCCLIEKYCRDGNLNGANEILEYLKEKNIPVNEAVFNSLIKGHLKINDLDGARDIMEVMRNSNISPSSHTYMVLACFFADKKEFEELEKVFTEVESLGISFSNNEYLQILLSTASNNDIKIVDYLLQKLDDVYEWRQDYMNAAAELVHKGLDNIAHKLIMKISSTEYNTATNHFLKILIKNESPVERVIQYCTEIYNKGYNGYIFTNGAKISVDMGKLEHAIAFFTEMQQRGIPVRTRSFGPLFAVNKYSAENTWKVMKTMAALGIPLDYVNYKEHILPAIGNEDPQKLISKIEECGHSVSCIIDPLFEYYCSEGKIDNAVYLIENYSVKVNKYFNLMHFLSLYYKYAKNPIAYFKVLKYVLETVGLPGQDVIALRGEQLASFLQTNPRIFEAFHKSQIGQGCNYDGRSLAICRKIVQRNAPNLLSHLHKIGNQNMVIRPMKKITVEEEDELIHNESPSLKSKTLTELLTHHIKNQDLERVNLIKDKFESEELILPPTSFAQIFFLECEMGHLEAAKKSLEKIKEVYSTFKLETARLFDYARLLLKYSNFDDARTVIENECKEVNYFSGSDLLLRSVRRFLNNVVQTGNVDFAKELQTILINNKDYSDLKEVILEPVVKIYLYKEDIENSLKEFENCVVKYHCSPCQNLMMKKLILADDHTKLQAVVDLASKVEGNSKTLHKLGLVFLDLDHFQKACKVFQNLGRAIDYRYLEEVAKEYLTLNQITVLENLLHATSSLKHADRICLYNLLLTHYCKKNQYNKCSQILDIMKHENIAPSSDYKQLINDLCVRNKKPLHFPDISENIRSNVSTIASSNNETVSFLNFLRQGNTKEALKELNNLKKGYIRTIPLQDMSHFIEILNRDNCLSNLATNTPAMGYVIENSSEIFKPLFEKYSENGNVEAMVSLASVFPDFSLKKSFFNSFFAHAYFNSNRHEDLLSELETRVQKKNKLFSMVAFQELLKIPHLEDRLVKLAKIYSNNNFDIPLAIIWAHYFVSEQFEKAKEISQITLIPVDKIDPIILRHVKEFENIELGKKYVDFVSCRDYRERSKERAYGTLLDLLVLKEMHEDAANLVIDAKSKNINLEKFYQSTLTTLKYALERENKPVPFSLDVENIS